MNEINKIVELGLPIVSPMRDLAMPEPVLDQLIYQTCMSYNYQIPYTNLFPCGTQMGPVFGSCPAPAEIGMGDMQDIQNVNTYDARAATFMHDFENSLNHMNPNTSKDNPHGGTYCPAEANDLDYHQTSEVNTDVFTPNRKTTTFRKSKESVDGDGVPLLEKLKGHFCTTKHVYNSTTKRMNKVITCNYPGCGKEFNKTWNILDHFKVHTGEKPYKCGNCKKSFSQKGNLTKHLKLHSKCSKMAV